MRLSVLDGFTQWIVVRVSVIVAKTVEGVSALSLSPAINGSVGAISSWFEASASLAVYCEDVC